MLRTSIDQPPWVEGSLRILGTGLVGLWHMRPSASRRRARNRATCPGCRHRHHRMLRVLAVVLGLQTLGVAALLALGLNAPLCQPPPWSTPADAQRYVTPDGGPVVPVRQIITAGQTGLALVYAEARGADVCRFAPNGNLTARMRAGFARGGTMFGHVFLTYPRAAESFDELVPIKRHEARHTEQWALFTLLGGPAAFPIAYSLNELVAPGSFNHFERHAGLADGNYAPPDGQSPTTTRLLLAAVLAAFTFFERHRVRRQIALVNLLARRFWQRTRRPWWYAHTKPAVAGRLLRLVRRISPRTATVIAEHNRLRQLGCPACGYLPGPLPKSEPLLR